MEQTKLLEIFGCWGDYHYSAHVSRGDYTQGRPHTHRGDYTYTWGTSHTHRGTTHVGGDYTWRLYAWSARKETMHGGGGIIHGIL